MAATPNLIDKSLLRGRLDRALSARVAGADFLMMNAIADIAARLGAVERQFDRCVTLNGLVPELPKILMETEKVGEVVRLEPTVLAARSVQSSPAIVADEEALPLGSGSVDLIVAPLAFQWSNDLPGALAQIRHALKPDGLLLASMIGGETLQELRLAAAAAEAATRDGASPRILPFADVRDLGNLLQRAGFALPVVDRDRLTVRYDTSLALIRDLRAMGATNTLIQRSKTPLTRQFFFRMEDAYRSRFADADGRVRATFDVLSLSGWTPHESQQKPARRGSGQVSLADVLGKGAP